MKLSHLFPPTLFEEPQEAEVASHKLMIRAGLIRMLASGIYSFLPLGKKVLDKVSRIIKEEMDGIGGQDLLMPALHPAELWQETGRWQAYGPDMFKLKDRKGRDFGLGPTHEEIITHLVRNEVRSYRQLPLMLYQIQVKFRDEPRPRFGILRGREFIMKDAYSFDLDKEGLDKNYEKAYQAYCRIFERCGLDFVACEAESGLIGGDISHEFMVLAPNGEDRVVGCSSCDYAANLEKAEVGTKCGMRNAECGMRNLELLPTPGMKTVGEVGGFLKVSPSKLVKTLIYEVEGKVVAALIKGDQEINESKLAKACQGKKPTLASPETIKEVTGAPVGFAGPVGLSNIRIIADNSLRSGDNFVVGANKEDAHYINANIERDFKVDNFYDLKVARDGDPCPRCEGSLKISPAIELGHVFKLGTKYSEKMKAVYKDEKGEDKPIIMGCYGIGVTRIIAAVIEVSHDPNGIIWPAPIAPFQVHIICVNTADSFQSELAFQIYKELKEKGFEVLIDDRDERPGRKFKDADLIGIPLQVTVGKKSVSGQIELTLRKTGEKLFWPGEDLVSKIRELLAAT
ncbi:proline--tRNA ligase [bacterium]|nr:proline--tRNA ligase [bacterium]